MMRTLMTTSFALLMTLTFFAIDAYGQKTLPSREVQTLSGERVNIADHAKNGKITVISFWATWCSPCKKELDAISEVYEEWQEMYDIELLAISIDNARSTAKIAPMVSQKGWDFTIYLDPNQLLQQDLNFTVVPQMFVLDKEGEIIYEHTGYVPGDEYELEELLEKMAKS